MRLFLVSTDNIKFYVPSDKIARLGTITKQYNCYKNTRGYTESISIPVPFDSKTLEHYFAHWEIGFRLKFVQKIYEQNLKVGIWLDDEYLSCTASRYLDEWWKSPWVLDLPFDMIEIIFKNMLNSKQKPYRHYYFHFSKIKEYLENTIFVQELPKIQKYLCIRIKKSDFYQEIFQDYPWLTTIYALDLHGTKIKNVDMLGGMRILNLSSTDVVDVSSLTNVQELDLSFTEVEDVSSLTNVQELDLSYTEVTNVSSLVKARKLDLSGTGVTDVSMLEEVQELNLSGSEVIDTQILKMILL